MNIALVIVLIIQWLVLGFELGIGFMRGEMRKLNMLTQELSEKYSKYQLICVAIIFVLMIISFIL